MAKQVKEEKSIWIKTLWMALMIALIPIAATIYQWFADLSK